MFQQRQNHVLLRLMKTCWIYRLHNWTVSIMPNFWLYWKCWSANGWRLHLSPYGHRKTSLLQVRRCKVVDKWHKVVDVIVNQFHSKWSTFTHEVNRSLKLSRILTIPSLWISSLCGMILLQVSSCREWRKMRQYNYNNYTSYEWISNLNESIAANVLFQ